MLKGLVKNKDVVVVGNASNIKGIKQQAFIDACEVVIRLNLYPVKDDEIQDIGSKTDIYYVGYKVWDNPEYAVYKDEWHKTGKVKGITTVSKSEYLDRTLKCGLTGILCLYDCLVSGCKRLYFCGFDSYKTPARYIDLTRADMCDGLKSFVDKGEILLDKIKRDTRVHELQ